MLTSTSSLLTSEQVAKNVQLSPRTIERLAKSGEIAAHKVAGKWRYKPAAIEKWLEDSLNKTS